GIETDISRDADDLVPRLLGGLGARPARAAAHQGADWRSPSLIALDGGVYAFVCDDRSPAAGAVAFLKVTAGDDGTADGLEESGSDGRGQDECVKRRCAALPGLDV